LLKSFKHVYTPQASVDAENAKNCAQVNNFPVPVLKTEAATLPELSALHVAGAAVNKHLYQNKTTILDQKKQPNQNAQPTVEQGTHRTTNTSEHSH
jgi:hypothetical protein